jgi:hypothetical protein
MSIKLSQVPLEHQELLFENLIRFRGVNKSGELILENAFLSAAFPWVMSEQGHKFWQDIDDEVQSVKKETVEDLVAEAESRGFKEGVWTKFGLINGGMEHELCNDNSFYYRNIKVRTSEGKWCKPNVKPKKDTFYDQPNIIEHSVTDVPNDVVVSAIHEVLHRMFKDLHK